jgi:phage terminase small subunit
MNENQAETTPRTPNLASPGKSGGQTENPKSTGNLKLRHEKFVEYYLANGGNATQAARDAGYSPNPGSLRTLGSWLLKKPEVQERIRIRILEGARVHTDEVLGVLANQMRANLMDVLDDNGHVDMVAVRELDLGHLVKRVTIVKQVTPNADDAAGQPQEQVKTVKMELQSQTGAVNQLARILRNQNAATMRRERDRIIERLRDVFAQVLDEVRQSEVHMSGGPVGHVSIDELFEQFAEVESATCGFSLHRFKDQILKGFEADCVAKGTVPRTA